MIQFLNQNAGALTVIFTAAVAISTVVYAILTARLVKETQQMRQAQTEPKIEVLVKSSEYEISLIGLYIKNIGLGPAYNIYLKVSAELQNEGTKKLIEDLTEANFSKIGLKYLGPGQELFAGCTAMIEDLEEKINAVLNFDVKYQDVIGKEYQGKFLVDFSEFKGTSRIDIPPLYSIAKSLEAIEKSLSRKMQVDIYTQKDRERGRQELERRKMERQKRIEELKTDSSLYSE